MTAYSSMIKMLKDMDSMQVVVIRGVLQLLIMGAIAKYKKLSFRGTKEIKIAICLFFVAFTGGLRLLFIFTSFSRLPLGDSTTILFSSPVIVMFLSIFILKENCGVFRMVAATTLIAGVILIAKPPILFGSEEETYDIIGELHTTTFVGAYSSLTLSRGGGKNACATYFGNISVISSRIRVVSKAKGKSPSQCRKFCLQKF